MSDKSETCGMCEGQGVTGIAGHLCDRCNGTGVTTTGEVVGTPLPRWPEVRPIREESGARVRGEGAPNGNSPENPESSGEAAGAGTADRGSLGAGIAELSATIAEQSAEIESLRLATHRKIRRVRARRLGQADGTPPPTTTPGYQGSSQQQQFDIALQAQVIADQNKKIAEQAAEIERLNRELDAERATSDRMRGDGQQASVDLAVLRSAYAALEAERDELRLEVARLRDRLLQSLAECGADQAEAAANARAEKYLAVIRAKDEQLVAAHRCWAAAIKATAAMSAAGIVIKAFVPSEQEETDHE